MIGRVIHIIIIGIIHMIQIRAVTIEDNPFKNTYLVYRVYRKNHNYRMIGFKLQGVTIITFYECQN